MATRRWMLSRRCGAEVRHRRAGPGLYAEVRATSPYKKAHEKALPRCTHQFSGPSSAPVAYSPPLSPSASLERGHGERHWLSSHDLRTAKWKAFGPSLLRCQSGGAPQQRRSLTPQHALIDFTHTPHPPRRLAHPRSTGFCAIWDCVCSSSCSSARSKRSKHRMPSYKLAREIFGRSAAA